MTLEGGRVFEKENVFRKGEQIVEEADLLPVARQPVEVGDGPMQLPEPPHEQEVHPTKELFAGTDVLDQKKERDLNCSFCGVSGIKDKFNLDRHIARMHLSSVKCCTCLVEFSDRYWYDLHSGQCYHYCPFEDCSFKEKRRSRIDGHIRRHARM